MLRIAIGLGVLAVLLCLLFYLAGPSAFAQQGPPCGDADRVETMLEQQHGERVVGFGVIETSNALMRIWATPGGETWSVTVTMASESAPSGFVTCLVGSGTAYRPARIERGEQS